ncbi:MAG: hypothetical protein IJ491_00860 [Clostridia bacterium]|nr:hypothetical protein [Clostridia bacterium]
MKIRSLNKNVKKSGKKKSHTKKNSQNDKIGVSFLYALVIFIVLFCLIISLTSEKFQQPEPITDSKTSATTSDITTQSPDIENTTNPSDETTTGLHPTE